MNNSHGSPHTTRNSVGRPAGSGQDRPALQRSSIVVHDVKLDTPVPAELFGDIAKDKAAAIAEAGAGRKNKSTQLRKFYDELVMWHEKVNQERTPQAKADKYAEIAPFIKMMKAKVAYARGRDHVDECFEQLFSHLVSKIDGIDSLKHAKLFMEAFMGFYKAQEK
jgi:CRISPR-associated protein Csm2